MKIKGIFVIPLIAIMIAMFTIGVVPGFASDTTAQTSVSDSLTYVDPSYPPTSSFDQELEGFISDAVGDSLQQAGGPIRGISEIMSALLKSFRNVLTSIIKVFEAGGSMLGNGSIGNISGGLFG